MRDVVKMKEMSYSELESVYSSREVEPRYIGTSALTYSEIKSRLGVLTRINVYHSSSNTRGIMFNRAVIYPIAGMEDGVLVMTDLFEELTEDPFVTWAKEVRRDAGIG